jgi:hypothetical protein
VYQAGKIAKSNNKRAQCGKISRYQTAHLKRISSSMWLNGISIIMCMSRLTAAYRRKGEEENSTNDNVKEKGRGDIIARHQQ